MLKNNNHLAGSVITSEGKTIETRRRKPNGWKILFWLIILTIAVYFAWIGGAGLAAFLKISHPSKENKSPVLQFWETLSPEQMRGEGDGRINILLLGKGGSGHPGGELTDSIILTSLNPKDKSLALLSIPRDLAVKIPGFYETKINEAYYLGEQKKKGSGAELVKKTIGEMLDLPIHYYLMLDFSGFKKMVDTLGGITIDVDKPLDDFLYPASNMIDYQPLHIKTGRQMMNGDLALKYARSRETTSDFDRSRRQGKVLLAIKEKSLSLGILANPKKVSDLLKVLGEHLRSDLSVWEMERLIGLVKDIDRTKIITKVIDTNGILAGGVESDGVYRQRPRSNNFKEIQRLAHEIFSEPYLAEEQAKIEIIDASGRLLDLSDIAGLLKSYGYKIARTGRSEKMIPKTVVYDQTYGQKPFTVKFLMNRFKAQKQDGAPEDTKNNSNIDIYLVLGQNYIDDK